ncbi:MAG TPA: tetratricopeptide repeat protein [Gemmatimonadales bacterium]|nr:tetratricopeptide repeat protein [Gemmatimonadales bacterium]
MSRGPRFVAGWWIAALLGPRVALAAVQAPTDPDSARRVYAALVAADSFDSRAVFRLARLTPRAAEALRLYRRYTQLEPDDPWGHMALGDALARAGRYHEGLASYAVAERLAPGERDVAVGRARLHARAGRTDAAVAAYERWLAHHEDDAEAWRELGRELMRAGRARGAASAFERSLALEPDGVTGRRLTLARAASLPAIDPHATWSRDSDGNTALGFGGELDISPEDRLRWGVSLRRVGLADGLNTASLLGVGVRARWRPRATVSVRAALDAERLESSATADPARVRPALDARVSVRAPGGGPSLDIQTQSAVLSAGPALLASQVRRTEAALRLDLPLRPLRLRAGARGAAVSGGGLTNYRSWLSGGAAIPVADGIEMVGLYHRLSYRDSTSAGYFAPRLAEVLEVGSYVEVEPGGWLLALDVGAGAQRTAPHGQLMGDWKPALRLWGLTQVTLSPGRNLRLEVEAYDTQVAPLAATTGAWRYLSTSLGLRLAL